MRLVKHWNWLPREAVEAPLLKTFTVSLDRALSNLVKDLVKDVPAHCRGFGIDDL